MNDEFSIREMVIDDIPFFNEVRNSCYQYLHDKNQYSLEESIDWFKSTNPKYFIFLYNSDKAGYFRTKIIDGDLFIGLDICSKHRGKKLAVKAYDCLFSYFGQRDYFIYVDENNYRAYNLYLKMGFLEEERLLVNKIPSIKMKLSK